MGLEVFGEGSPRRVVFQGKEVWRVVRHGETVWERLPELRLLDGSGREISDISFPAAGGTVAVTVVSEVGWTAG